MLVSILTILFFTKSTRSVQPELLSCALSSVLKKAELLVAVQVGKFRQTAKHKACLSGTPKLIVSKYKLQDTQVSYLIRFARFHRIGIFRIVFRALFRGLSISKSLAERASSGLPVLGGR